jgi:hypothetical protein
VRSISFLGVGYSVPTTSSTPSITAETPNTNQRTTPWRRTSNIPGKYEMSELEVYKIHAYVLVPKSFIKYMFSTVYRVIQKDVYARCVQQKFRELADLRQLIFETDEFITPHMLINKWQELEYRSDIYRASLKCTELHKNLFELLCTLLET